MSNTTWQDLLRPGDATDFFKRRDLPPFEPQATGYSLSNALWLAELSRIIYRHDKEEDNPPPTPTQTEFLTGAGFTQRKFFISPDTDTQAMLVKFGEPATFAALVFRGTEQTAKDLCTDANVGCLPSDNTTIGTHQGFKEAIDSVWGKINSELEQLTCPVYYTGHSLGAALATLAAYSRTPTAVYTFGSPRVGNQAFVDALKEVLIYRIVDDEDMVTKLPPVFMGFRHVGTEYRLTAPESAFNFDHIFNPPKPLADHAPINYVDRLK